MKKADPNTHENESQNDSDVTAFAGTTEVVSEATTTVDEPLPSPTVPPDDLPKKVEQLEESLARARADYQNLQRRTTQDRMDAVLYANAELMKSLVVVLDDFDRALAAAKDSDNHQAVVEGVRLVNVKLQETLAAAGLETIVPLHQPFDPKIHQALLRRPTAEDAPGTVVEVVGRGFKLRDRVIRPARVIVAAAPESNEQGATSE